MIVMPVYPMPPSVSFDVFLSEGVADPIAIFSRVADVCGRWRSFGNKWLRLSISEHELGNYARRVENFTDVNEALSSCQDVITDESMLSTEFAMKIHNYRGEESVCCGGLGVNGRGHFLMNNRQYQRDAGVVVGMCSFYYRFQFGDAMQRERIAEVVARNWQCAFELLDSLVGEFNPEYVRTFAAHESPAIPINASLCYYASLAHVVSDVAWMQDIWDNGVMMRPWTTPLRDGVPEGRMLHRWREPEDRAVLWAQLRDCIGNSGRVREEHVTATLESGKYIVRPHGTGGFTVTAHQYPLNDALDQFYVDILRAASGEK